MNAIKYHCAYTEDNVVVDIDSVTPGYRNEHRFHCIACGAEMIAKLGSKNTHHFAHKGNEAAARRPTFINWPNWC